MDADSVVLEGVLAERDSWRADNCSVGRALEVIGTRSAMLIMREAFYGARRFEEFSHRVGITETVAAARLRELTDAGLFVRTPYREPGQRTRHEYRLTDMGRDVLPAVLALMQWGDRYLSTVEGGPLRLTHRDCGAEIQAEVRCAAGHEVAIDEISVRARRGRPTRAD
jgi:DNA-binding HxlR family transcriptional regulator